MAATKVLIFSNTLTGGGAERVASNLADGLAELGYNVVLYCIKDGDMTYAPTSRVNLHFYTSFKPIKGLNILRSVLNMRSIIKTHMPDIVIGIQSTNAFKAKMALLLSGQRIPIIYSEHNSLERPSCAPLSRMERFYKFFFSRFCNAYTVLTNSDKVYGESKGLKNIVVMPNPLQLKPVEIIPYKEKIVLAVGRLNVWHYKGFDILVRAWELIAEKYPDWQLQIAGVGSESEKNKILSFVKSESVKKKILFLGYSKDVIQYYKKSSIFVLSSRYEGFGLVLTEAMSQRCACIATDYKGRQADIITDGVNGFLCSPENIDDLAKKIELLIVDKDLRECIQRQSLMSLDRFSPIVYAKRWDSLIKKLYDER